MSKIKAEKMLDWFCNKCDGPPTSGTMASFETVCICQDKNNNYQASLNLRVVGECGQCHKYFHMHCIRVIEFNGTMSCPRCCNENSSGVNDIVLQAVITRLAPQSTMNSEENVPLTTSQSLLPMKVIDKKQADYLNCMTSKNAVSIGDGITRKRKEHGATENTNTILIEENYEGLKLNGTTPPRSAKKNDLQNMKLIENTSPSMDCGSLLDNAPLSQPTFKPKKLKPPSKLSLAYRKALTQ